MAKKFKAGNKFIFHKCKINKEVCADDDLTIGKVYELFDHSGDLYFKDDTSDDREFEIRLQDGNKVTKIVA